MSHIIQYNKTRRQSTSLFAARATLLLSLLFLIFNSEKLSAQACCLTDTLIISTGYDPNTGGAAPIGGSDPEWSIIGLSHDNASEGGAVTPVAAAWDINPGLGGCGPNDAISFVDRCCVATTTDGIYTMWAQRCFTLCQAANVTFNLSVYADDWVSQCTINGIALDPADIPETGLGDGGTKTFSQTVACHAGVNCITVEQNNYAWNTFGEDSNGNSLIVCGFITTATPIIQKETTECATFAYCNEPAITGYPYACVGGTTTLSDAYTGGTWSSSNTDVAVVNEATGVVTGVSAGMVAIVYTDPCGRMVAFTVTIVALPTLLPADPQVCAGGYIILSGTPTTDGAWMSSVRTVGYINGGSDTLYGERSGHTTLTYSYTYDDAITCSDTELATVVALPDAGTITGPNPICLGSSNAFSETVPGGTWSSYNPAVASVDASGTVYGVSLGTAWIVYTVVGADPTYCLNSDSVLITVITLPPAPSITLSSPVVYENCLDTLMGSPGVGGYDTGVSWAFSSPSLLSGTSTTSTLVVTGSPTTTGTTTVYYYVADICGSTPDSISVDVIPRPPITGPDVVCSFSEISLADSLWGGTWSSSNTAIATVTPGISGGGVVTGVSAGTDTIIYTTYCGSVTKTITVLPLPDSIRGDSEICYTFSTTFTDSTTSGVWSSNNTSIVTIDPTTGFATGVGVGFDTIVYTSLITGCARDLRVTVNPLPAVIEHVTEFSLADSVCVGSSIYFSDSTAGGSWISSNTAIAITDTSFGAGVLTGVSVGAVTLTYMLPTGCYVVFSSAITVLPLPSAITGPDSVCVGSTIAMSDDSTGGMWSAYGSRATVADSTGVVTGVSAGRAAITYTMSNTCSITDSITVNPLPAAFTVGGVPCVGATSTLSDAGGGTWSSMDTSIATIVDTSGIFTGVGTGTDSIVYTLPTGCSYTGTIAVNPLPSPITGVDSVCVYALTLLSDTAAGGTWSSTNTAIARAYYSSGNAIGVSPGVDTITYTLPTGCTAAVTLTVNGVPAIPPITGADTECAGETINLYDSNALGIWTTSSSVVSVGSGAGSATVTGGYTAGTAAITYTVSNECGSASVFDTMDVVVVQPPIIGNIGICAGTNDTLTIAVAGGTWSIDNPSIATVSGNGIVTGLAGGPATISYTATSACGTFTSTLMIYVNKPPLLTSNFVVACMTYASGGGELGPPGGGNAIPPGGCYNVCDSSVIRYYANGDAGAITWTVNGGTVIENYGDSIDVMWPTAGVTGSISFTDTAGKCETGSNLCVQVIQRPHAYFTSSASSIICAGSTDVFTNLSTGDPLSEIVSSLWSFGDGTYSTETDPSHIYNTPGKYLITLVVTNACNCTDTFGVIIDVDSVSAPPIYCPSIVCQGQNSVYSTDSSCGSYSWSIQGGRILSGRDSSSVVVDWSQESGGGLVNGYGQISLSSPCDSFCSAPATVSIPVLPIAPVINGPNTLCASGQQYQYSLPLWAATQYHWGVLSDPGAIVGYNDNYEVTVSFVTPGIDTIHAWYQNELAMCGGNTFTIINVAPEDTVTGPGGICINQTASYSLSTPYLANWTLTDWLGDTVATGLSDTFTYTFTNVDMYYLFAGGAFCANPQTIYVQGLPVLPSVTGADTVCLDRVYNYSNSYVGTGSFTWTATNGYVTPSSGSDSVSAVWYAGGGNTLTAVFTGPAPAYCVSLPVTVNIVPDVAAPNVTGVDSPCANGMQTYFSNYTRGDSYTWTITPDTAGSVVLGADSASAVILWNNYAGPAQVTATVHKCDSVASNSLSVYVVAPAPITISASPALVCPYANAAFTATAGGSLYYWNWGDGYFDTTSTDTTSHWYQYNLTSSDILRHVTVQVARGTGACPVSGSGSFYETELPGPVAYLTTGASVKVCPGDSALLVATVTHNVGGLSYQWWEEPAWGFTDSTRETFVYKYDYVYADENVYFTVIASDGCSASSDWLTLYNQATCSPTWSSCSGCGSGGTTTGAPGPPCGIPLFPTYDCNVLTLRADSLGDTDGGTWTAVTMPASGPLPTSNILVTATYDTPGIYLFTYQGSDTGCYVDTTVDDTVGIMPNFVWQTGCASAGLDSVFLQDYSVYLTWWNIDSMVWDTSGVRIGAGPNLNVAWAAMRSYNVTETVYGTRPGGTFSCTATNTISLTGPPAVAFTATPTDICEGVPITFTPTDTVGIVGYHWDFGDTASSLLQHAQRTYKWNSSFLTNPHPDTVTLTVTDSNGCTNSATQIVSIQENLLGGQVLSSATVCSSDRPVILSWLNFPPDIPTLFTWSNGIVNTTGLDSIYSTGSYWVTVMDGWQCRSTFPDSSVVQVKILYTPQAYISGSATNCSGYPVYLSDYLGSSVKYQWYLDGSIDPNPADTSANIVEVQPVGTHVYQLAITVYDSLAGVYCYDTSAADTINVYSLPSAPVITGPMLLSCAPFQWQLTASDSSSGFYNWSNREAGPVDIATYGGPASVIFTDVHGCSSFASTTVPMPPDNSFAYFPTGCYNLCAEQLPLTLSGPPDDTFIYWAWLDNDDRVRHGWRSLMHSYRIDSAGSYQWVLGNGSCNDTSAALNVSVSECSSCAQVRLTATARCTTDNPASYNVLINFTAAPGSAYILGTDAGPVTPFSGTVSSGPVSATLTFTTLYLSPLPDSITVQLLVTMPNGAQCYDTVRIALPTCTWEPERKTPADSTVQSNPDTMAVALGSAMLVFPNPSSGNVTISYDYGSGQYSERDITIYDEAGRQVQNTVPPDSHGNWVIDISRWMPGIYIIRMDGDGKALQTQRLVVISH